MESHMNEKGSNEIVTNQINRILEALKEKNIVGNGKYQHKSKIKRLNRNVIVKSKIKTKNKTVPNFNPDFLKTRHKSIIDTLYPKVSSSEYKCSSCSQIMSRSKAAEHLDQHFIENRKAKAMKSKCQDRDWYPNWNRDQCVTRVDADLTDLRQCFFCWEDIEMEEDEDEEVSYLVNCVLKKGKLFHPGCCNEGIFGSTRLKKIT